MSTGSFHSCKQCSWGCFTGACLSASYHIATLSLICLFRHTLLLREQVWLNGIVSLLFVYIYKEYRPTHACIQTHTYMLINACSLSRSVHAWKRNRCYLSCTVTKSDSLFYTRRIGNSWYTLWWKRMWDKAKEMISVSAFLHALTNCIMKYLMTLGN